MAINGDMLGESVNAIGVLAPTVAASKKQQVRKVRPNPIYPLLTYQQTRFEKEGNEEGEGGRKEEKKRKKEGGDQAGIDG